MSNVEDENSNPRPAPGMTVVSRFNDAWGAGTVMMVQGERARVLFTAHPERKPVVVPCKSLVVTRAGDWEAAVNAVHRTERTGTTASRARPTKKKAIATTTQDEAVRLFQERYEGGFAGTAFTSSERDAKWQAHLAFAEHLGGPKLGELLANAKVEEIVKHALDAVQKTNLLSVFDKARLSQALRDERYAETVFKALAEVLSTDAVEEKSFSRYLEAILAMPARPGQRSVTWPIATILPFVAAPDRHLFMKPRATQAAAERLQFDLQYQTAPSWTTYQRACQLASDLRAKLAELGCRDLIDVQSFISVTG